MTSESRERLDAGPAPEHAEQPAGPEPATDEQAAGPEPATDEPADDAAAEDPAEAAPAESREVREPEDLADALASAERARDEYLDHLRRERAEFENFRRRSMRERMDALDRGAEALIANLLGVLDNFGFVLRAAEESSDEQLAKGAHMVHAELLKVLQQAGLEEVPGVGEPFDPVWHEAMMQVEAEGDIEHPTVVEVLRPGYRFKGRVLRPASVSVAQ